MPYTYLSKLYYSDPAQWRAEYQRRVNSPSAVRLPLEIHQYNRKQTYQAWFCYTPEIALLQEEVMHNALRLFTLTQDIPADAIDEFLHSCFITEIKSSNDIEGVSSTHREIRLAMAASGAGQRRIRFASIVNKYRMILSGDEIPLHTSADIRRLYDEFLADEIRRKNPRDLPDGTLFRADAVDLVTDTQKVVHRGVAPESKIIADLDALLLLTNETGQLPALVRMAIFHYYFAYIHPFYDGNGRMARFITAYQLSRELHPIVAMQLSFIIKSQRKNYYQLFRQTDSEINCGDLTPLIIETLRLVSLAIVRADSYLRRSFVRYLSYLDTLGRLDGLDAVAGGICEVLLRATLFGSFGITAEQLIAAVGKSKNTVYGRLRKLPPDLLRVNRITSPYLYRLNLQYLDGWRRGKWA